MNSLERMTEKDKKDKVVVKVGKATYSFSYKEWKSYINWIDNVLGKVK